jgi:dihydrofolate synthase/folylpolyglutamate synthase
VKGTFFEATTAIAFQYFAEQRVDIAIIETGLGGRLDATNVLRPLVSVITSIGKDHTEQLGSTITSITREKAGIIKRKTPVVIGNLGITAQREIRKTAAVMRSPLLRSRFIKIPGDITVQLRGRYQKENARCAIAAVTLTLNHFVLGDSSLKIGLEKTSALTGLRGRFETVRKSPAVILDVAHNPDGIRSLTGELQRLHAKKYVVVFGVMKDKDSRAMLTELRRLKPLVICTQPKTERALTSTEIGALCDALKIRHLITGTVKDAVERSQTVAGKIGTVVVTGSHYVVAEAMMHIKIKKMP